MTDSIPDLTTLEFFELTFCTSNKEWNSACDKIKASRNGIYPPDWYEVFLASGLMASIVINFQAQS